MKKGLNNLSTLMMVSGITTIGFISVAFGQIYSGWNNSQYYVMNPSATSITTNQVNFPVLIRLTSANGAIFSNSTSPADLRFAKGSNLNIGYPYQVERWDATGQLAEIWVLVDTVFASNTSQSIVMYYGNSSATSQSNGAAVFSPSNGFLAVWHLADLSDATGNGYTLTNTGAASKIPGVIDTGYFLNGSSQYLSYPSTLGSPATVTLSCWANVIGTKIVYLVSMANSPTLVSLDSINGDLLFYNNVASAWPGFECTSSSIFAGKGWTYIAGVINPLGSFQGYYQNGSIPSLRLANGIGTSGVAISYGETPSVTAIGYNPYWNSGYVDGYINEVRIENVARSADWIKLCYLNQQANQTFVTLVMPVSPALSSPANGAFNQALAVTLTWGNVAAATSYAVQVSTSPSFGTIAFSQAGSAAMSFAVSGLSNATTYYWRANCSSAIGTSAWSSFWSFSTPYPTPDVPSLTSPSNGAINKPVPILLSWSAVSSATGYTLQISSVSDFSIVTQIGGITAAGQSVGSLASNTTYYWKVNAENPSGNSAWSSVWSFTTGFTPTVPVLSSPASGSTGEPLPLTLGWNAISNAATYSIQVSTSAAFATLYSAQSGLASNGASLSGLTYNDTYYWRANAANAFGTSAWSGAWSFTTANAIPVSPVLSSPVNGASAQQAALALGWTFGSSGGIPASYTVQVSTSQNFSSFSVNQGGIAGMSQPITGLAVATTYYWRVNGSNTLGTGPWSTEWSFVTIISAPEAPSLASPGNNAVLESTAPLLSWGAVAGAASYAVQLSTLSNFLSFNQDTATNVSTTFSGLAYNKYYWRVNAMNSLGISAWSTVWSFTTTAVSVLSTDAKALESSCYVRGSNLNYAMAQSGAVRISFSDILGRERAIINSQQSSGHYTCSLKTLNLSPGVYLMHFRAGTMEKRMKVMIH